MNEFIPTSANVISLTPGRPENIMKRASDEYKKQQLPTDIQIGGDHYRKMKIQPIEFIIENNLDFCQGSVIKYICRYKDKNGLEDLKKAKHYIEMLIQLEYKDTIS